MFPKKCWFGRVELEDAYGGDGMAVLDCKGKVHLNQVYLCLEQDPETHLPGDQVRHIFASVAFLSQWLKITKYMRKSSNIGGDVFSLAIVSSSMSPSSLALFPTKRSISQDHGDPQWPMHRTYVHAHLPWSPF